MEKHNMAVATFEELRKEPVSSFEELRRPNLSKEMTEILYPLNRQPVIPQPFNDIVGQAFNPEEEKMRLMNTMYFSDKYKANPSLVYHHVQDIAKQNWGEDLTQAQIYEKIGEAIITEKREKHQKGFMPVTLFGQALMKGLAEKPAAAVRGVQAYTRGEGLGIDWMLRKTSDYIDSIPSDETVDMVNLAASGKLWPVQEKDSWYKIDPKLLPETVNAWAATVGEQIPIMLMTWTGRAIGKKVGAVAGTAMGITEAVATAGADPTDVVAAPLVARLTAGVIEHLSGAAPMVAMEAGYFMDRADELGIDKDIRDKYARLYGLGSGTIEYAQNIWMLKAWGRAVSPKAQRTILKKVLYEIGGNVWEGMEELSQQGLENWLVGKAITEQKVRTPGYNEKQPPVFEGGQRAFGVGMGVSMITRMPGHAFTTARKGIIADQIQKRTGTSLAEARVAVNALADGAINQEEFKKIIEEATPEPTAEEAPPIQQAAASINKELAAMKAEKKVEGPQERPPITKHTDEEIQAAITSGKRQEAIDLIRGVINEKELVANVDEAERLKMGVVMLAQYGIHVEADVLKAAGAVKPAITPSGTKPTEITAQKPSVAQKQPWEMTPKEFAAPQLRMLGTKGITETQRAAAKHKKLVEQALSEGKPVPAKVLAEYPDLKPAEQGGAKEVKPTIEEEEIAQKQITKAKRSALTREVAKSIRENEVYQIEADAYEDMTREIQPGYFYASPKMRTEIEDAAGGNKKVLKMFTYTDKKAVSWDQAVQEMLGRNKEGVDQTWGYMDISEFVERLVFAVEHDTKGTIKEKLLEKAVSSGEPDIELLAMKYEALKAGLTPEEVNDTIEQWLKDNPDIDRSLVESEFIKVKEEDYVKGKQEFLRKVEKKGRQVKAKLAPEEAAIKKAREVAYKGKIPYYVYEQKGKYKVSKNPPAKGAYQKVTPPVKDEITGKITEEFAGLTAEQEAERKQLIKRIHAVSTEKGLSKVQYKEIKRKVAGIAKSSARMTLDELRATLKKIEKARPRTVDYKKVITQKTEKKIQTLKTNLKKKLQMTDDAFEEILQREIQSREPKYINAKHFITEAEGKEIIKRMHDAAEVLKVTESFDKAIRENPEVAEQIDKLKAEIATKKKRDPFRVESMRYYTQQSEVKAGAPIFSMYMDLLNTHLEIHKTRHARILTFEKEVPGFKEIAGDEAALIRVGQYIASQSTLKDKPAPPAGITANEKKLAAQIQKVFKEYELKARVSKFFNWYYYDEGIAEIDRYKKEINKARDIYEGQGKEELIEYLKTQEWGVVRSGYEPLEAVIMKIRPWTTGPKTVGKSHIKIRTDIEYHTQERNILQRLNAYMRQMDMLYNLSPKINAFIRLYDDNMSKFDHPRMVKESIEHFIANLKRYNIEGSWVGDYMARMYAQASQIIIMAQPVLAFRNLFQNAAFEHDKTILFDPRNEPLTPEENEYRETYVQQMRSMLEEYFMVNEKALPGTVRLMKILRRIKIYAWSDVTNRDWGFWAKINQVKRAQTAETVEDMMDYAKFEDMAELEQIRALGILARDGKEAMARYVARVHVDDIHFLYERAQRSPAEMSTLGRVFGNLMLFPRAYAEKLAHQVSKLTSKTSSQREKYRAAKILVSVMAGGTLVGAVYTTITGRKRNPYDPFELLNFRLGGLVLGLVEDVNETYSLTIRAMSGDKKALYALTTILPRMADVFIPFYDWTLRGLEAAKGMKNIDRKALREILELIDKEYKVRKGAYKMKRDLVHALQYFFAGASVDKKEGTNKGASKPISR